MVTDSRDNENVFQVFFDDNVYFEEANIVDFRDLVHSNGDVSLSRTHWNAIKDVHVVKAEPMDIIHNEGYFVEWIRKCEQIFHDRCLVQQS